MFSPLEGQKGGKVMALSPPGEQGYEAGTHGSDPNGVSGPRCAPAGIQARPVRRRLSRRWGMTPVFATILTPQWGKYSF